MSKSKVFVTQRVMTRDPASGGMVPRYDLSNAKTFGEIVFIFGPGQQVEDQAIYQDIEARLDEEDYDPETDYLLVSGSLRIGMQACLCVAARGPVRELDWDQKYRQYFICQPVIPPAFLQNKHDNEHEERIDER